MELCVCAFKLRDGLAEVQVVHEEITLQVIQIRMQLSFPFACFLGEFIDVLQGLVVLRLLLEDTQHQQVFEGGIIFFPQLFHMRFEMLQALLRLFEIKIKDSLLKIVHFPHPFFIPRELLQQALHCLHTGTQQCIVVKGLHEEETVIILKRTGHLAIGQKGIEVIIALFLTVMHGDCAKLFGLPIEFPLIGNGAQVVSQFMIPSCNIHRLDARIGEGVIEQAGGLRQHDSHQHHSQYYHPTPHLTCDSIIISIKHTILSVTLTDHSHYTLTISQELLRSTMCHVGNNVVVHSEPFYNCLFHPFLHWLRLTEYSFSALGVRPRTTLDCPFSSPWNLQPETKCSGFLSLFLMKLSSAWCRLSISIFAILIER